MARSTTSKISFSAPTDPSPPPVFDDAEYEGELSPGRVLSQRYRLLKRLGSGGMGVVFHALDLELNEDVALKVLLPDLLRDKATAERFRNEVKLARKIAHAGVCRVFDVGEDGALRFLTMELIEGRTLRQLLSAEEVDAERAYSLLLQVAEGLSAVHERGIVHRDLKPENVLVRPDGRTVLVDFGLARDSFLPGASSGGIAGTPRYMSPEQLRGGRLDVRSDVFSFGVMAFEMLCGRAPFGDGAIVDVATAILRDEPLRFEGVGFSEARAQGLRDFFEKALAKAPEQRFGSAGELRSALEGAWVGYSLRPRVGTPVPGVGGKKRWGRRVSFLVIMCSLFAGIFFIVTKEPEMTPLWFGPKSIAPVAKIMDGRPMVEVLPISITWPGSLELHSSWDEEPIIEMAGRLLLAELRKSTRFGLIEPGTPRSIRSPVWVVDVDLRYVGEEVHIAIETRETGNSSVAIPPIEIDGERHKSEQFLRHAGSALLKDITLLVERQERRRRAIEGTENAQARGKLLSFYQLMDNKPKKEDTALGMKLLDEALKIDTNYVPALTERADLFDDGIGVENRVEGLKKAIDDLDRALAVNPYAPDASVMYCRARRLLATEVLRTATDGAVSAAEATCLAVLAANPESPQIRLTFTKPYDVPCDGKDINSRFGIFSFQDQTYYPPLLDSNSAPALIKLIGTALIDDLLSIADKASLKLIEFEERKRSYGAANHGLYLMRGAVLMRLSKGDTQYLLPAKDAFEKEIERKDAYAFLYEEKWFEASAIRGLMHLAARERTKIKPEYERRLASIEHHAKKEMLNDSYLANRIAIAYQWTDPEAALQWLELGVPAKSFEDAFLKASLYHETGQDGKIDGLLKHYRPLKKWLRSCPAWFREKIKAL